MGEVTHTDKGNGVQMTGEGAAPWSGKPESLCITKKEQRQNIRPHRRAA